MATIISFPTRTRGDRLNQSQLDAVRVGIELLGADQAQHLPILLAAIANRTIPHEPGHVNGTTSRNALVSSSSSCA